MKQRMNEKQPTTTPPPRPLAELYRELGEAFAVIFEHPDTPASVHNILAEFADDIGNQTAGIEIERKDAMRARANVPFYLDIITAAATGKERA
jgi:hypothetical protein